MSEQFEVIQDMAQWYAERKARFFIRNNGRVTRVGVFGTCGGNPTPLEIQEWETKTSNLISRLLKDNWEEDTRLLTDNWRDHYYNHVSLISSCEDLHKLLLGVITYMNWMFTNGYSDTNPDWETYFMFVDGERELVKFFASENSAESKASEVFQIVKDFPEVALFARGPGLDKDLKLVLLQTGE